jgi:hypothetical protein
VAGRERPQGRVGFDADDVQLLEAIGAIGASALENPPREPDPPSGHPRSAHRPSNQLLFEDHVNKQSSKRGDCAKLAVLVVDLDGFQKVNASLGPSATSCWRVGGRLTKQC